MYPSAQCTWLSGGALLSACEEGRGPRGVAGVHSCGQQHAGRVECHAGRIEGPLSLVDCAVVMANMHRCCIHRPLQLCVLCE
jgi:hypothetical protein